MRKPKMLKGIKLMKDGTDKISVYKDKSCNMLSVAVNGMCVMEGNSGDFYNGCHGHYDIPEYNSYMELVSILKGYLKTENIEFKEYTYKY